MTIITKAAEAFTGPLAGNLPVLVPTAGVPGYLGRWLAATLTEPVGAPVLSFKPVDGTATLAPPTAATAPLVAATGGDKYLDFDAVDDYLAWPTPVQYGTLAMVFKITSDTASGNLADMGGVNISRGSFGNLDIFGGVQNLPAIPTPKDVWHVMVLTASGVAGTNSTLTVNSTTVAGNMGGGKMAKLDIGRKGATAGPVHLAEAVIWPTQLTAAQHATVVAALKSIHAPLFA